LTDAGVHVLRHETAQRRPEDHELDRFDVLPAAYSLDVILDVVEHEEGLVDPGIVELVNDPMLLAVPEVGRAHAVRPGQNERRDERGHEEPPAESVRDHGGPLRGRRLGPNPG
jgi:hypothetical protein